MGADAVCAGSNAAFARPFPASAPRTGGPGSKPGGVEPGAVGALAKGVARGGRRGRRRPLAGPNQKKTYKKLEGH